MSAVTNGLAKELLPVRGLPVLAHIVDEALLSGAERVRVVGSPVKPLILDFVRSCGNERVEYAEQEVPLGLLDAVRSGAEAGQPALVLMGDTFFTVASPLPALERSLAQGAWGAVAVSEVPIEEVSKYGVVGFDEAGAVNAVVEKPSLEDAPSRWAVASRFALSAEAVDAMFLLAGTRPVEGLSLSELLDEGIRAGKRVEAVSLSSAARFFDCGCPEGYAIAIAELGE
jgi:UTP-glucose-1-phosphate uridylyltransferase